MKKHYEVAIIGGGVMGASLAWHLTRAGLTDVIVLDRAARQGEGSTGKATGGFRAQFSTEANVRLSLLSREKYLRFHDETGIDPGYSPCGYLFIATDGQSLGTLRAAREVQRRCGLSEAREVMPREVLEIASYANGEGIIGGVFCPTDGFIVPLNILRGYTEGAQRMGARFECGIECGGFFRSVDGNSITAVKTSAGMVSASIVVNAAGAWAATVSRLAGVEIPVTPLKRQVACTFPTDLLPHDIPMTIFTDNGFHLRVRDGRVLLLMASDFDVCDPFDTSFNPSWLDPLLTCARQRIPALKQAVIDRDRCWAGLYEMSPDKHAILGPAPGLRNFWLMNGSSGHGVMHSPALGQLLAEMILGINPSLDVSAFRPGRFEEGLLNPESGIL